MYEDITEDNPAWLYLYSIRQSVSGVGISRRQVCDFRPLHGVDDTVQCRRAHPSYRSQNSRYYTVPSEPGVVRLSNHGLILGWSRVEDDYHIFDGIEAAGKRYYERRIHKVEQELKSLKQRKDDLIEFVERHRIER